MTIDYLINNNYEKIKKATRVIAFKMFIRYDDLLSLVNYKLTITDQEKEHPNIDGFLTVLVKNAAIDIKRNDKLPYWDEISELVGGIEYQPNFELKNFEFKVVERFLNHKSFAEIFKMHFINGKHYQEIADEIKCPIGTVKFAIHRIRKYANKNFGENYRKLVA